VGATSFFPSKPLGCFGDGGAIFTNDEKLLVAMKEIREHGSEKRYYHTRLGINGRLDTIQCAIILAKLERFPWEVAQRQKIAERYNQAFASIKADGFSFPKISSDCTSVWAQYTLIVKNRDSFQKKLTEKGIPTSVHYPQIMPDQPWYKANSKTPPMDWTVARWAANNVISLPMFPDMSEAIQDQVIKAVKECV